MKFYHVTDTINQEWHGTLAEAHAYAKKLSRFEVSITEVEVATDKAGVLYLLKHGTPLQTSGRVWVLTNRGGLKEEKDESNPA